MSKAKLNRKHISRFHTVQSHNGSPGGADPLFDLFQRARGWAPLIFVLFCQLLDRLMPFQGSAGWAIATFLMINVADHVGIRLLRDFPSRGRDEEGQAEQEDVIEITEYWGTNVIHHIFVALFTLASLGSLVFDDTSEAFAAATIAAVPVGVVAFFLRLRFLDTKEEPPPPDAPVRLAHWLGLALLMLSAAATWHLVYGTIAAVIPSEDIAAMRDYSLGDKIEILSALAIGMTAAAVPAAVLFDFIIPQVAVVQGLPILRGSMGECFKFGMTLGVNLLLDLASFMFL